MGHVGIFDPLGQIPCVVDGSPHYNVPEPCLHVFSPHQFAVKLDVGSPLEEVR
jgi:hypothetical protein